MSRLSRQKAWRAQPLRRANVMSKKLDKAVRAIINSSEVHKQRHELGKIHYQAVSRPGGLGDFYRQLDAGLLK